MLSFKQYIQEMAKPSKEISKKVYYHGTSKGDISSYLEKGIIPPNLSNRSGYLKPVEGKVYITPSLEYGTIYALGGVYMGMLNDNITEDNRYGHLFVIKGNELKDVQPDEDSIGKMIYNDEIDWLNVLAKEVLMDEEFEENYEDEEGNVYSDYISVYDAIKDGIYEAFAHGGKIILHDLTDEQKIDLINNGAHIAHGGRIDFSEVWRIDKRDSNLLKKDGSNFFKIAKRIQ